MRKFIFFLILLFSATLSAEEIVPQNGEEEVFQYEKGECKGSLSEMVEGDLEGIRFSFPAPVTVKSLSIMALRDGSVDLILWNDNGAHMPDLESKITSITVETKEMAWVDIDLTGKKLNFEAITNYWIGHFLDETLVQFCIADTDDIDNRSIIRKDEEGEEAWYILGETGNFMVRVKVVFKDVAESFDFEDRTEGSGLEELGKGRVSWGDVNNDGFSDLLYQGRRLFLNNGDLTFTEITEVAGLSESSGNGGVFADYNNDGCLDFYAATSAGSRDTLWKNNCDITFSDVTESAGHPADDLPTEAAGWGDIENDGFVDIYAANYEDPENMSSPNLDYLWRNNGDGTFSDYSVDSGIRDMNAQCGRAVNWGDFDQDGLMDIFVSNYRLDMNFLFKNIGSGRFNPVISTPLMGEKIDGNYGHTIGSQWADYDNDGDWDLFNANLAHPRFIEFSDKSMLFNNDNGVFTNVRESSGITFAETHSDPSWGDFDNDGHLDLFITSVYEGRESFLYRNNGNGTFSNVNYSSGLVVYNGWGGVWADIDNDGDLDLFSSGLFVNTGPSGNWIEFILEGKETNRAAIGTTVIVNTSDKTMMRMIEGGKGTGTQSDLKVHFGLGDEKINEVIIKWLGQKDQKLTDVEVNKVYKIIEGEDPISITEETDDLDSEVNDDEIGEKSGSGCSVLFQ